MDWSPGCEGVNALKHNWRGENGCANPPFNLVSAVVDKAIRSGCALTLVVPRWRAKPWYWKVTFSLRKCSAPHYSAATTMEPPRGSPQARHGHLLPVLPVRSPDQ